MCPAKTSPCVPAPRAHMFQHVRVLPVHTGTFWTDTREEEGRGEVVRLVFFIGKTSDFFNIS